MAEDRKMAGDSREPRDPRSADPEAAAREVSEREGIPFEAALEDVRASIAKREAAARRIRAISEQVRATLAAREARAADPEDGHEKRPEEGEASRGASPGSAG